MSTVTQPKPVPPHTQRRPPLRLVGTRRRGANLHLLTYVVRSAFFWALWGALSVSADTWYWWAILPVAGWAVVLGLHLWYAYRP